MKKMICIVLLVLVVMMVMFGCIVQVDQIIDKLKVMLQVWLGNDVLIKSVLKLLVVGFYEVNFGLQIIYSDVVGDYVLFGDFVDVKMYKNLIDVCLFEINKIDFVSLLFVNVIKVVKGNGVCKIVVFFDLNCLYCKKFEMMLQLVDNVIVYMFLYLVLLLDLIVKLKVIWCVIDCVKMWESWMFDYCVLFGVGICDISVLDKNFVFGCGMNVIGMLMIFLLDGCCLLGVVLVDQFNQVFVLSK